MLERSEINIVAKSSSPRKTMRQDSDRPARASTEAAKSAPAAYPPFARILVAVDESEPSKSAVDLAAELAAKTGAIARLIHVIDTTQNWDPELVISGQGAYELFRSEGQWLLRRAQKRLGKQIRSDYELLIGNPIEVIVADAKQWNADVIVIGTHGRGRLSTLLIGSTAQGVVQRADCPVLVVGPHTLNRVKVFLKDQHITFTTIPHRIEFTAARTANTAHVPPGQFAKTLLVKLDGQYALAVVPADRRLDLELLRRSAGVAEAKLASEEEVAAFFPKCEVGAMPPLGHLYGLDVFVDLPLVHQQQIVFNGGTHDEAIAMTYGEFEKLSRTQIVEIGKPYEKPVLSGALQI
jgi:Ala-tRNA(Pro) deacylase